MSLRLSGVVTKVGYRKRSTPTEENEKSHGHIGMGLLIRVYDVCCQAEMPVASQQDAGGTKEKRNRKL